MHRAKLPFVGPEPVGKGPEKDFRVHVLEVVSLLEPEEAEVARKDDMAKMHVDPTCNERNHLLVAHRVNLFNGQVAADGKELRHHVEVSDNRDAEELVEHASELGERVPADLIVGWGIAGTREDGVVREEERGVEQGHLQLVCPASLEQELAWQRDSRVGDSVEEALN
jgi:hypothetical protein